MKTPSSLKQLAQKVLAALIKRYPHPKTNLEAASAWQLLCATILSAQCTDARVNTTTKVLFSRWPDVASFSKANLNEVEEVIRPVGFYHNKAKNILACAQELLMRHNGAVPQTLEELMALPGVGRKTANVVLFGAYGINEGLAVDTHVRRISYRLQLTKQTEPERIEQDLLPLFPRDEWGNLNHRMVVFGREICRAQKPLCDLCDMNGFCAKKELPRR